MDCMQSSRRTLLRGMSALFQYRKRYGLHAIASVVFNNLIEIWFQYRKRYGLHAIGRTRLLCRRMCRFNTASGMDCMQYCLLEPLKTVNPEIGFLVLSRPRDKSKGRRRLANGSYAKTSQEREPRAKRDWLTLTAPPSLFALFPKPRGTFLSQKAVQKGCKASNIKETFVHEENLKLMTVFRKSRTSLQ